MQDTCDKNTNGTEVSYPETATRAALPPPIPCLICENPGIWESIYRDKNFRCPECDPWPAKSFVGQFWILVCDSENKNPGAETCRWEKHLWDQSETIGEPIGSTGQDSTTLAVARPLLAQSGAVAAIPDLTTLVDAPSRPCKFCQSTIFRDTKIRGGETVRRDCAKCKKFVDFVAWG